MTQAHLQFALSNTQPKIAKELLPAHFRLYRMMKNKKHEMVTMYIKNKRDSSNIKACSSFELYCKLKVLCSEIAYFS
jgi:hypothetical protein